MKKNNIFFQIKNSICDCFSLCKIKLIIIFFVSFVALLTGIIIAIKCYSSSTIGQLSKYGLVDLSGGMLTSSFFSRLLSMLLCMLLLFLFSLTPFCMPLAFLLIAYRSYLLGLNLALMFILYGFPGVIISFVIALPCQLLALIILCFYYVSLCNCCNGNTCTRSGGSLRLRIALTVLVLLLLISLIESLLLLIFNAKVILVI